MVSFMDSNTHYNQPHKMLLSHCVYVCFLCLCSALLTLTFRFEAGLLCLCKDHSAHRTSHNAPPPVLACHRSTEGMWGVRGGRKGSISYQPRVSTVGCLFILCNLALIGAKMQTQWQIRCLIPYSKPSLGDAWWSNSQPRGQTEGWAVGMPFVHHTVLYKCRKPMSRTIVDEEVLALLTIWGKNSRN